MGFLEQREHTTGDPSRESLADIAWFRDAQAVVSPEAIASKTGALVSVTGGSPTAPHPAR